MTQAHSEPVQATLPTWVPPIGSTVHLRPEGRRSRAMPYTIAEYKEVEPGDWVFRAYDLAGWKLTDSIDTLR